MSASVLAEALVRWQHAAGPFWPYVCAAPFLDTGESEALIQAIRGNGEGAGALAEGRADAPDGASRSGLAARRGGWSRHEIGLADRLRPAADDPVEREHAASGPMVVLVDGPAAPVLTVAPLLVERGWYVVPVVQRWIASPAVLPCRRLLQRLVAGAWLARRPTSPRGAILIADGERMGRPGYPAEVPGRAFDNRYEYQICRFPSMDFLQAQGVQRARWIGAQPGGVVRPDLAPYLEEMLRTGLLVDVLPW